MANTINTTLLKDWFPWLDTEEEANGADTVEKLLLLYEVCKTEQTQTMMPAITWERPLRPIGINGDSEARLLGTVSILGADFHVEACEVKYLNDGEQVSKQDSSENYLDEVLNIVQGSAQTVMINGREYVLFITPYQC